MHTVCGKGLRKQHACRLRAHNHRHKQHACRLHAQSFQQTACMPFACASNNLSNSMQGVCVHTKIKQTAYMQFATTVWRKRGANSMHTVCVHTELSTNSMHARTNSMHTGSLIKLDLLLRTLEYVKLTLHI